MKPVSSSKEAKELLKKETSGVSGDTILIAKCIPYQLELLEILAKKQGNIKSVKFFGKIIYESRRY